MENEPRRGWQKKTAIALGVLAVTLLIIILVANNDALNEWVKRAVALLRPILIGLVLAYLCNPIFCLFERVLLYKLRPPALRRATSLTLTYICLLLILALIVLLILPQLIASLSDFAKNYQGYMQSATNQINRAITSVNTFFYNLSGNEKLLTTLEPGELEESIANLFGAQNTDQLLQTLSKLDMKPLAAMIGSAMSAVTDTIFGIFISIYLLSTKEKRYAQVMKVRRALFSDGVNARITRFCTIADRSFGGYLEGKLLDSLIVGVLTFSALYILGVPYSLLISSFIAIANIIPIVGPFIGAIPAALILLISAPTKLIPFLVVVVVIQQLDGNVISPKILGNNTGVSPLCVMIAISTLGALWGLVGMVLGVPLFATLLEMADEFFTERLQKKGLPSGVENYYPSDAVVDPSDNAHVTLDRMAKRFERYVARLQAERESTPEKPRRHALMLWIHRRLIANGVIRQLTDEEQARISAELAAARAAESIEQLLVEQRLKELNAEPWTEDTPDEPSAAEQADQAEQATVPPTATPDTKDATQAEDRRE